MPTFKLAVHQQFNSIRKNSKLTRDQQAPACSIPTLSFDLVNVLIFSEFIYMLLTISDYLNHPRLENHSTIPTDMATITTMTIA